MTDKKKRRGPMTAGEFMAQLEADPEYQRRARARDAERARELAESRAAQEPILADLRDAGFDVKSVWDLGGAGSKRYERALPVLLSHLEKGGYPDRVMEGLAQALAVRSAAFAWDRLRVLYLNAQGPGEIEGLAAALTESATPDRVDDLIALLDVDRNGKQIHFLSAILRLGGKRGREVLAARADDATLGKEARALLRYGWPGAARH